MSHVTTVSCNLKSFRKQLGLQRLHKIEHRSTFAPIAWIFLNRGKIETCNMASETCSGILYPSFQDKLQEKFHRVTLALKVKLLREQKIPLVKIYSEMQSGGTDLNESLEINIFSRSSMQLYVVHCHLNFDWPSLYLGRVNFGMSKFHFPHSPI